MIRKVRDELSKLSPITWPYDSTAGMAHHKDKF
jgi:hypothetical protein